MERSEWAKARRVERQYGVRLRKVAQQVADLIRGFDPHDWVQIRAALERYAQLLFPWAHSVAEKMIAEIAVRDRAIWRKNSALIGRGMLEQIDNAPIGEAMRASVASQVHLITSLPLEAAQRVQRLAIEASATGMRADDLAKKVLETGNVTKSRATLIARTEVGRALTALTASRAQSVGSTTFIWRTMGDAQVRESHRKLNGRAFRWDDPPVCDAPDIRALPGSVFNCRCFSEPVLPEND